VTARGNGLSPFAPVPALAVNFNFFDKRRFDVLPKHMNCGNSVESLAIYANLNGFSATLTLVGVDRLTGEQPVDRPSFKPAES
jgi:hypothetical protein